MSDSDRGGSAWIVGPSRYLESRPATYALPPAPRSLYVAMRDGCRLALDVYLPQPGAGGIPPERVPAILVLTPYYRRFALVAGAPAGVESSPAAARYRDMLVPRGYALVVVDVRGTGASFGSRDSFRSPAEREDYREIVDWVVAQPWSNGMVGATGISYVGAACDFLASTGHPAIKAIAPLFAVWDTWGDHYLPGGLLLTHLAQAYDELMVALDHDRRELLPRFAYFNDPRFAGPAPVEEDADAGLCREAVREHLANFRMPAFISEFRFKDDTLASDPDFGSRDFSPYHYAAGIRREVAIYAVSGWFDGAGYSNGAIARYLTLPNPHRHLLIGPWDHGARTNVSPWRAEAASQFPLLAEILRFFDHYLLGRRTGLEREAPVHLFAMHEERWHAASQWPAIAPTRRLYLAAEGALAETAGAAGEDAHRADFTRGTGTRTRYERLAAAEVTEYYADWHGRDAHMLRYTGAPLAEDVRICGHPVLDLWLAADQKDAAIHAYLEEVEADGACRYVTEGMLRALHRKERPAPDNHRTSWPYHGCSRADAAPLVPGEPVLIRFALLPVSWTFRRGSRIRLALAGADCDHFGQVPHGRPPRLTVQRGGAMASSITLPWEAASL